MLMMAAGIKPPSPVAATGRAIQELKREVQTSSETPPRSAPDFFASFPFETDRRSAALRLLRVQDSRPRTDAYVRWQLTAIADPAILPEDRSWDRLLRGLPALPTNPLADERKIRILETEAQRDQRSETSVKQALDQWSSMEDAAASVELWAQPGRRFRAWLIDHAPGDDERLAASLEDVHAEVLAGWDPQSAIARMDELCGSIGNRQGLDGPGIKSFRDRARPLLDTRRSLAEHAWGSEADRTFGVEVTFIAIQDYDLNRWIQLLRFGTPDE